MFVLATTGGSMLVIVVGSVEPIEYPGGFVSYEEAYTYLEDNGWKLISSTHHVYGFEENGKLLQAQVEMIPRRFGLDYLPTKRPLASL